jgi:hypothetical protein
MVISRFTLESCATPTTATHIPTGTAKPKSITSSVYSVRTGRPAAGAPQRTQSQHTTTHSRTRTPHKYYCRGRLEHPRINDAHTAACRAGRAPVAQSAAQLAPAPASCGGKPRAGRPPNVQAHGRPADARITPQQRASLQAVAGIPKAHLPPAPVAQATHNGAGETKSRPWWCRRHAWRVLEPPPTPSLPCAGRAPQGGGRPCGRSEILLYLVRGGGWVGRAARPPPCNQKPRSSRCAAARHAGVPARVRALVRSRPWRPRLPPPACLLSHTAQHAMALS